MLAGLRAKRGWPRAIALLILVAFSAGLLHVHASGSTDLHAAISSVDQGHDHGDHPGPSVTAHCVFCAVVAGKFYVAADLVTAATRPVRRVTFALDTPQLRSAVLSDLFRPPIALAG